jgi:hypothetical protein
MHNPDAAGQLGRRAPGTSDIAFNHDVVTWR